MTDAPPRDTPAAIVIAKFGGVAATARRFGKDRSTVARWRMSREHKGLGGRVPGYLIMDILDAAVADGIDLTIEDLR